MAYITHMSHTPVIQLDVFQSASHDGSFHVIANIGDGVGRMSWAIQKIDFETHPVVKSARKSGLPIVMHEEQRGPNEPFA